MTLWLFLGYLVATVGIGLWAATRGSGDQEDYFLGGRRVSAFAMALSAVSSGRSAWLVVGASASAWQSGLSAVWLFPGYVLAEALIFVTLGPRLRERSAAVGAITLPETIERLALGPDGRAGTSRLPLRQLAGLVTVVFLMTYVSAQFVGGAKTLNATFDVDGEQRALIVTALIVLGYTLVGGYRAVVVTDVVQALFMLAGMVILPLLALHHVGGFGGLMEGLRSIDSELLAWSGGAAATVGALGIGLGSLGNPHILVRHMSLRDPSEARAAALTGTTWNVVMAAGAFLMGLVGRVIYPTVESFAEPDREYLFATLGTHMSAEYLFAGFAGVLLAALFAAVMSTCDSQLLVIASSLVRDFRSRGSDGDDGRAEGLGASRIAVLVTVVVAVALAFGEVPLVHEFVLLSWAALGAAFGPPLVLLLYDERTTARGVFAGILTGVITVVVWARWPALDALIYELVPAFGASLVVTWLLRRRSAPAP